MSEPADWACALADTTSSTAKQRQHRVIDPASVRQAATNAAGPASQTIDCFGSEVIASLNEEIP
jgi:hypothetical protein